MQKVNIFFSLNNKFRCEIKRQRSKKQSSPPSQKHWKCIYSWSNSHKTATEYLQKNSDVQKDKKTSTGPGRTKGKKKKNQAYALGRKLWRKKVSCTLGRLLTVERLDWTEGEFQHLKKEDPNAGRDWELEEKGWQRMRRQMASSTWCTLVWVNSGSWWWTGRPGVLRFMGSWRVGHDWATELKEERAATGLWKARWRVAYTEGQNHHTEFPNLRYPSNSEGGGQVLKLKLQSSGSGEDQG